MTLHLDELRTVVEAATVADGGATLGTAPGWPGREGRTQTYSWATLQEWSDLLADLAARAKATVPKSERQLEQEREAAEAFASFDQDCVILAELLREGGLICAHPDPAALAERYGFDQDAAVWFTSFDWLQAIVNPLSLESRDNGEDCACPYCVEPLAHGQGDDVTYRLILCSGGPHYELAWPKGDPEEAHFIALPWFGRVELCPSDAMIELATWLDEEGTELGLFD